MPISLNYTRFTYNYRSPIDESDAVATFSVECTTSAYVALDDVSITNNALAASASSTSPVSTATTTVFETETIVQSQIYTQVETTTFISGSEIILTTTIPTIVYQTVSVPTTETRTVSTVLLTTETATTAVPNYVYITVSSVSTITSKSCIHRCRLALCLVLLSLLNIATLTKILNSTVVSYQLSLVVQTEYDTSTALFTTTQPGLTLPASTHYQNASTAYVTLEPSTVVVTLEQPVITVTPPPVTLTSTSDAQTSILISYLSVTATLPFTLPQATAYITPSPVTSYVTLTLEPDTITVYVSVTLPPLTDIAQVYVTLPVETAIQTFTPSPSTETLQLTVTQPQVTDTVQTTQTLEVTSYEPTVTETYTPAPESSVYVPPPPSGVPAVALARPTAIVGDVNGAPYSVDDDAYSVRCSRLVHRLYSADLFDRSHFP
jgi:hypothetical protein